MQQAHSQRHPFRKSWVAKQQHGSGCGTRGKLLAQFPQACNILCLQQTKHNEGDVVLL